MNLREAAQQALEYIEQHAIISGIPIRDALRAALAEDRVADTGKTSDHIAAAGKMVATSRDSRHVEPVAWMWDYRQLDGHVITKVIFAKHYSHSPGDLAYVLDGKNATPLYTAPPKRELLTDEEIHDCFQQKNRDKATERRMIARAIERAHGIGGEE